MVKSVFFILFLFLFLFNSSLQAQTVPWVKVQNSQNGQAAQLLVDYSGTGTSYIPYFIKAVGYQPTPIGRYPSDWGYATSDPHNYQYKQNNIYDDRVILKRDFQLLQQMNVNTIRIWSGANIQSGTRFPNYITNASNTSNTDDTSQNTLDLAASYGLKVIAGFWVNPLTFTTGSGGSIIVGSTNSAGISITSAQIIQSFVAFVNTFKGNKAILFWAIGNENNLQQINGQPLSPAQLTAWYSLVDAMAKAAHQAEGATFHPVAVVNGEIIDSNNAFYIGNQAYGTTDTLMPDLDIWGVNAYRGKSFGTLFSDYAQQPQPLSRKPLWISEFGVDAWHTGDPSSTANADSCNGSVDESTQATWEGSLWNEIVSNASVAIGGSVMEYSDEWWQPNEWMCGPGSTGPTYCSNSGAYICTDPTKCTAVQCQSNHSFFGNLYPNFPDGYMNQEWFGLMAISANPNQGISNQWGADTMKQRQASYIWTPAALTVNISGSGASISSSPAGITNCASSSGVCASNNFLEYQPIILTASGVGTTVNWGITGCQTATLTAANPTATCSFAPDASSLTVSVSLSPVIAASAGNNGSISPSGSVTVRPGGTQVFTIIPNNGYRISQVLVDGNVVLPNSQISLNDGAIAYFLVNSTVNNLVIGGVQAAHTVSASFAPIYTVSASTVGLGTVICLSGSNACPSSVIAGTIIKFIATPAAATSSNGVVFGSWSGVTCSDATGQTGTTCTVTINSNTAAVANFIMTYSVLYGVTGTGAGTLNCNGSSCPSSVNAGTSVTVTATPALGSKFSSWGGACAGVGTTISPYTCTVAVNSNTSVSANFTQITYTITASAGVNGSISPIGSVSVNYGASQIFTITPNAGYNINQVLVDGQVASLASNNAYTFNNVMSGHTISASFIVYKTITASSGTGGTISPSGVVDVSSGANQTFTVTPNSGYKFNQVLVDRKLVKLSSANTYTFSDVTVAHTITASFNPTITASAGTGGRISPSGVVTVNSGSRRLYLITPQTGFGINQVLVDGKAVKLLLGNIYIFSNVTVPHTIIASFNPIIMARALGAGTISPSGSVSVTSGSSQTFKIVADKGHEINEVSVDGKAVKLLSDNSYIFSKVTSPHTITVSFITMK